MWYGMKSFSFREHGTRLSNGRDVSLRFPFEEHSSRLAKTRLAIRDRNLDALLVFAQESHYYLTGFDTAGYVFFQVGIITADEQPTILLTRRPDKQQAYTASLYDDIRIWFNDEGINPADELKAILHEIGLRGARLGVEFSNHGLTAGNSHLLEAALDGFCLLEDGSDIVRIQRLTKSAAELDMMRVAGRLADAAVLSAVDATFEDATEGDLSAAALSVMLKGGGEVPSGGPLVNSGPRALFGRGISGPKKISKNDQVIVELAASFCRYHVCIESTIVLGKVDARQTEMMAVAVDAIEQIKEAARPGLQLGTLDNIHRSVLDSSGFATERFSACGYALGCTFKPTWMDVPPMIYSGNPLLLEPNMVFFVHIMIPDTRTGIAVGIGQTFAIKEAGHVEVFSDLPTHLFVR